MKKTLFIINPMAGKGTIRLKLLEILDIFTKASFDIQVYITQYSGDARRLVREEGDRYEQIICSGGDGTLDEVITGMMEKDLRIPVGYLPAGSTNDFAQGLNIPKNLVSAARNIVAGKEFSCDIGKLNDNYFVYVAAFGMFTDVSYETPQDMKNTLGHLAYILEGARKLTSIKAYPVQIETESQQIRGEFIYGMVSNSVSVGGLKNVTGKDVYFDDGEFEVTLIRKPETLMDFSEILSSVMAKTPDEKYFYQFHAACVRMIFEEEVPWTLDGEYGGSRQEVLIQNIHRAVALLR